MRFPAGMKPMTDSDLPLGQFRELFIRHTAERLSWIFVPHASSEEYSDDKGIDAVSFRGERVVVGQAYDGSHGPGPFLSSYLVHNRFSLSRTSHGWMEGSSRNESCHLVIIDRSCASLLSCILREFMSEPTASYRCDDGVPAQSHLAPPATMAGRSAVYSYPVASTGVG